MIRTDTKSDSELLNKLYSDSTKYNILQNKWNELKNWLEEQRKFIKEIPTFRSDIEHNHLGMVGAYNNTLDKMQELEGKK